MADDRPGEDDRREHAARNDFLARADSIDASVRNLLRKLDLDRTDAEHERILDAIMGACRAADALRAFAREDLDAATEATASMSYYARKALGEAA
ncbi:hypothetical protein [Actinophytocola sp.]|uniref:hypothetical protein n=1 Tax=Actinophytocola sp. TaxID=1872138 RepID=UPI002D8029F4|nr:hypothetical protein [Actinophytocola sp.]HET9141186.1 hypothetical protein [Actinophytocola sp.]